MTFSLAVANRLSFAQNEGADIQEERATVAGTGVPATVVVSVALAGNWKNLGSPGSGHHLITIEADVL